MPVWELAKSLEFMSKRAGLNPVMPPVVLAISTYSFSSDRIQSQSILSNRCEVEMKDICN